MSKQIFKALHYRDHLPVRVEVSRGRISGISRIDRLENDERDQYIAPGLFDNQVNGFAGVSFSFGGGELTREGVLKATEELWQTGVTTYLPTLTTNSLEKLKDNCAILGEAKEDPGIQGSIAGLHIEGPYISPEDGFRGAHPLEFVRKPDWDEFAELQQASGGNILQITLAPEVEGAMEFITKAREHGIVVALGHHNASADQIREAADRGAQLVTHLGNGLANTINRHENPIWPQLAEDRLMISIIGDGFHLRPEQIRVFYRSKGTDKTILTSDVTNFAALPPAEYVTESGETVELTPEGNLIFPAQDVLYGSATPISRGVGNIMKVTGCSMADAIQMASSNPARLYGFKDRGEMRHGMNADLVLFAMEKFEMQIKKTILGGDVVYEAD